LLVGDGPSRIQEDWFTRDIMNTWIFLREWWEKNGMVGS
jgi:hypothetical protein